MQNYDVIVIGAGPGGYPAAIRAAQSGKKTAIVEKDTRLGGTCLLRGCIPTKSLLHSADLLTEVKNAKNHGITTGEISFDFTRVQQSRTDIVDKSASGVQYLMKKNKIDVHYGVGTLGGGKTVIVKSAQGTITLKATTIIIATGSTPRILPSLQPDGKSIVTSNEILELHQPPKSLIVLGGGAVGVEFASVYARFGTSCTVIEMMDQLLPVEDTEVGLEFAKMLKKRGIAVHTSTKLDNVLHKESGIEVTLLKDDKKSTLQADMLLVAVGRAPVTEGLGTKDAGIKVDSGGFIEVDRFMQTSVAGIYAIGDVVRTPQLAHVATAEALLAIDHALGKHVYPINYTLVPSCTYSDPEVASVGLTERAATKLGYTLKIGKFPFSALGKARIMGQPEGFVKIVAEDKYNEVLGVHIIGPRATDLIAEACAAMKLECTLDDLAHTIHAHPTLPEAMLEATHMALGHALHI